MKKKIYFLLFLFFITNSYSQQYDKKIISKTVEDFVSDFQIQYLDYEYIKVFIEKIETNKNFENWAGVIIPVNYSIENSGNWSVLKDKRIWKLAIYAPKSNSISLYYNNFYLPKGSKLRIYGQNKGNFLEYEYSDKIKKNSYFATDFVQGEYIFLEYSEPINFSDTAKIEINELNYIPQSNSKLAKNTGFGTSDECQINVNCSQATDWQDVKNSTVRWLSRNKDGSWWCSGTVVQTADFSFKPYILSAEHNILDNNYFPAATSYFSQFIFYFGYESQTCETPNNEADINYKTLTGCKLIARSGASGSLKGSDFILLELFDTIPILYSAYYAGWSRENIEINYGFCLHHPNGDIKKISKSFGTVSTAKFGKEDAFWATNWQLFGDKIGTTEIGSSGSALFNGNKQIVGTLTSGESSCSEPLNLDYFGKFSYHWDKNSSKPENQLKAWLDPLSSGVYSISGSYKNANQILDLEFERVKIYPNPCSDFLYLEFSDFSVQNLHIRILNSAGNGLKSYSFNTVFDKLTLNLENFSTGIYFLEFKNNDFIFTKKIILK